MLSKFSAVILFTCLMVSCKKDCPEPADPVTPGTDNVHLTTGLLAHYPFNGNANDASGNALHGTFANGANLSYDMNGNANSALNLTGNNQKVIVNANGAITLDTAMTISFNAMPRTAINPVYISMADNSTGEGASFLIGTSIPGQSIFLYSIANMSVTCNELLSNPEVSTLNSGMTLQPESWYNIICIYRKGQMKLYKNGTLVSSQASTDMTMRTCPNAELLIGGWWDGDPLASFKGKIDEVRIYNRELNGDEINELSKKFK